MGPTTVASARVKRPLINWVIAGMRTRAIGIVVGAITIVLLG
ncbi:MAG: hypothetical protein ACI8VE_000792 [Natrialbaceae archaeon]|jgi:hypothetical protein